MQSEPLNMMLALEKIGRQEREGARRAAATAFRVADAYIRGSASDFDASAIFYNLGFRMRLALFDAAQSAEDKHNALAHLATMVWINFDLSAKSSAKGVQLASALTFNQTMGQEVPLLQAAGWMQHASQMAHYLWEGYPPAKNPVFFNQDSSAYAIPWFQTAMNVEPNIWRPHAPEDVLAHTPPLEHLFRVQGLTDDPLVARALQEVRDMNIANATSTVLNPEYDGPITDALLLMLDYDVRSFNALRETKGLSRVEVTSHAPEPPTPATVPFVVESRLWDVYERLCQRLGFEPYRPEPTLPVSFDETTLLIHRRS